MLKNQEEGELKNVIEHTRLLSNKLQALEEPNTAKTKKKQTPLPNIS